MTRSLRVAGAQLDLIVGDIPGNEAKIVEAMEWAEAASADVLVLPELAISGYPPEDLVLRDGFVDANIEALHRLAERSTTTATVVGFVDRLETGRKDEAIATLQKAMTMYKEMNMATWPDKAQALVHQLAQPE